MMRVGRAGFAVLAIALMTMPAAAQRFDGTTFEPIGIAGIEPRRDAVAFAVPRRDRPLAAIRLRVLDEAVFIRRLIFRGADGRTAEIALRRMLSPGDMSEPIDLRTAPPDIREIAIEVRVEAGGEPARLQLLGAAVAMPSGGPPPSPIARDLPDGWVSVGIKPATFDADRDTLRIGRERGRLERIALRAVGGGLFIREIRVIYDDREVQAFAINRLVPSGHRTVDLVIDRARFINEIAVLYAAGPVRGERPALEVLGLTTRGYGGEEGDVVRENAGWSIVGARLVPRDARESQDIAVAAGFGRISALRLNVRLGEVDIRSITLAYANGESETLPFARSLKAGEASPLLDLRAGGPERRIARISVEAKSRRSLDSGGVLEVWARH